LAPDLWQQWQRYASSWTNPLGGPRYSAPHDGAEFIRFGDDSKQFFDAVRNYFEGAPMGAASADAARAFVNSLREHYATHPPPWGMVSPALGGTDLNATGDFPALGAARKYLQRMRRMANAWQRLDEAQVRLQRIWSDVLAEAAAAFAAQLGTAPPADFTAGALHELYDRWIDCAEDVYSRAAHGESFCNALADSVNARSQWHREMQANIEDLAKLFDLPTRSEIDSLTRRLKAAEEELRTTRAGRRPVKADKPRRRRSKSKS
jgi:hypothetical protein